MLATQKSYTVGKWYKVEVPVTATKSYQGRLMRIIDAKDDGSVLMFQGRFPFSAAEDEIVGIQETEEPSTGVAGRLRNGSR